MQLRSYEPALHMICSRHIGKIKFAQNFTFEPQGIRPLDRPNFRWKDNVRMDVREIVCERMACIKVVKNGIQLRVMNVRFSRNTTVKLRVVCSALRCRSWAGSQNGQCDLWGAPHLLIQI